jgi:branched-chain amino acid transport system ATP-binding protein
MASLLEVDRVTAGHGESVVLEDVSFSLSAGDRLALLGRNGVGKTTLLLTLLGLTRLHGGAVRWQGRDLARVPTFGRARAGLGWVPQERGVYPSLTVEEHLNAVARPGHWDVPRIYQLFPSLERRRSQRGNHLSGGEQQMLAIGRALVTNPKLLLLDEPLEGLAPILAQELAGVLSAMCANDAMTMILVEQHARLALSLTNTAIVLDRGRVVHAGSSEHLRGDAQTLHRLLTVGV